MKKIRLILTGGTFGMISDGKSPFHVAELESQLLNIVPEIEKIAKISTISLYNLDSSDVTPKHWFMIAEQIEKDLHDFDGFVVVHGTDTMSYTATALSFMLSGLKKAVIFTGAQRPLSEIRTDARINLINSIELATYNIPEVTICFNNTLFRANRSKKMSTNEFDAFDSPNLRPLARIGTEIFLSKRILKPSGIFKVLKTIDTAVMSFPIYPGVKANDMQFLIKSDIKGIILEAFGAGNIPIIKSGFVDLIKQLTGKGKIVAIKSQSPRGSVNLHKYEGGLAALNAGAISCGDMTREASIIKLMFLLGNFGTDIKSIKNYFSRSLVGERTEEIS
jgi:L-asparaginase